MEIASGALSPSRQIDLKTVLCADKSDTLKLTSSPTAIFMCSSVNGLFVLSVDSLRFMNHIRPVNTGGFTYTLLTETLMLMAHHQGICVIDCTELSCSDDYPWQEARQGDENITGLAVLHNDHLLWVTSEGNLGCSALTLKKTGTSERSDPAASPKSVSTQVIAKILDSEAEEAEGWTGGDVKSGKLRSRVKPKKIKKVGRTRRKGSPNPEYHDGEVISEKEEEDDENDHESENENEEDLDNVIDFSKDDDELDSYDVEDYGGGRTMDVDDDGDENAPNLAPEQAKGRSRSPLPSSIHEPFLPGSTPFVGNYRYLTWNAIGCITSRQDEGYWSVEVEFADKNFHHPIRFIDETGFTMAALGRAGAVFASPGGGETISRIYISPLTTWAKIVPFTVDLPEGESALGIAIGASRLVVIATSAGYLRTVSINGLQGPIINYPGNFVSIVASDQHLMLLSTEALSSTLQISLYDLEDDLRLINSGSPGGRFGKKRITWLGFATKIDDHKGDIPSAALFDEDQVLHICSDYERPRATVGVWRPWKIQQEHPRRFWPISFSAADITGVVLASEDDLHTMEGVGDHFRYPEVIPRPMLTVLSLMLPFMELSTNELVSSFEQSYRTGLILQAEGGKKGGTRPEKETRRMQLTADKHILELIQLAIKADRLTRVLELCEFFLLEKSWDLAIQLARHQRLTSLANRIEELRDTLRLQPKEIGQSNDTTASLGLPAPRTPRAIISRMATTESPITALANLTPMAVREATGLLSGEADVIRGGPLPPAPREVREGDVQRFTSHTPAEASSLTVPLAGLSFKQVPAEATKATSPLTTRSLVDILKSVEGATATGGLVSAVEGEGKKRMTHGTSGEMTSLIKSKKQADLSAFGRSKRPMSTPGDDNQPPSDSTNNQH